MCRFTVATLLLAALPAQAEMPVVKFTAYESYFGVCGNIAGMVGTLGVESVPNVLLGLLQGAQVAGADEHQLQMLKYTYQRSETKGRAGTPTVGLTDAELADLQRTMKADFVPMLRECATLADHAK